MLVEVNYTEYECYLYRCKASLITKPHFSLLKKSPYLILRPIHYIAETDRVGALIDPDALTTPQQVNVALKPDFDSWKPCPFNIVPECHPTQISNIIWVLKK
jgi:hypothetical protein